MHQPTVETRPPFMATLGLLPPYTAEDVEQAYLAKIKDIRPAGENDDSAFFFYGIQDAYEKAREYVRFHGDRRSWIAKQVENYVATQEVERRLRDFGAEIETDSVDWLEKSIGDFAGLTETIVGIRLRGAADADDVILYMIRQHQKLLELQSLDLTGCVISDASVRQLSVFRRLSRLNLSRTPITWEAVHIVEWLPELVELDMEGTGIGWLTKRKLASRLRQKQKAVAALRKMHPTKLPG